tara:strand:+ start:3171 stop:3536 length:366 start_codon:yes stop_codon:yes gene_type:complete
MKIKFQRLIKEKVVQKLEENLIGVYLIGFFSKNKFKVTYIGRSKNLKRRLIIHSRRFKNHYFSFTILKNEGIAYKKEYELYLTYYNLKNKIAPSRVGRTFCSLRACDFEINKLLENKSNGC